MARPHSLDPVTNAALRDLLREEVAKAGSIYKWCRQTGARFSCVQRALDNGPVVMSVRTALEKSSWIPIEKYGLKRADQIPSEPLTLANMPVDMLREMAEEDLPLLDRMAPAAAWLKLGVRKVESVVKGGRPRFYKMPEDQ